MKVSEVYTPGYTLLPFQEEMVEKALKVPVFMCGDDMGLGKTIEGMEVDRRRRLAAGKKGWHALTLVVTTLGGTDVWAQHYADYLPNIPTHVIDPKNRPHFEWQVRRGVPGVYIVHWDALRMLPSLKERRWFHIIADEVHRIKNRKAQTTHHFKQIRSDYRLAMSGTPGDNKPDDMWSPLNWILPKQFGSYWNFLKYYCEFKRHEEHGYKIITGVRNVQHFHKIIDPYWIRRRKEQVAKQLPAKQYDTRFVELTPSQRRSYDQMRKKALAWVGENEDQIVPAPVVVTQLMRLQQFAVSGIEVEEGTKRVRNKHYDPARPRVEEKDVQDWGQWVSPKWSGGGKVWVGDNWLYRTVPITIYKMVDPSAKLDYLMDMLKDVDLDAHPIVVFTQFKRATALLGERLAKAGIPFGLVTGDASKGDRDEAVRAFQAGRTKVFVGTIGSCRESITLTRSHTIIFVDRAWSPSWNRQAEDRCHRLGQTMPVQVIDLIAKNTVDLGRVSKYQTKWTWLQKMFGDKTFDYVKDQNKGQDVPTGDEEAA
jgi:SNF2 family DNA or RNA helicase